MQTKYKSIHDNIHGYINISNLAVEVIDSPIFQRLRNLRQLGAASFIFPNANHTRFEHSIGTYYLAGRILECINKNSNTDEINKYLDNIKLLADYYNRTNNKLNRLDNYVCELVKIAALCHDLGHGPFSHLFDDYLEKSYSNNKNNKSIHHEYRSGLLIEKIIKGNKLLSSIIGNDEIDLIKLLINPTNNEQGFLFQIVSNKLNNLDVDKYDYITRDSVTIGHKVGFDLTRLVDNVVVLNNNICYPNNVTYDIIKMFHSRYDLHKQIYNHKCVVATQLSIAKLLELLEPYINITKSIDDMDKYIKMTDSYILCAYDYLKLFGVVDNKLDIIVNNINRHLFHKHIGTIIKTNNNCSKIANDLKVLGNYNFVVVENTIGFVSDKQGNPLDNIYSYMTDNSGTYIPIHVNIDDISHIIPKNIKETIIYVYCADVLPKKDLVLLREKFINLSKKI